MQKATLNNIPILQADRDLAPMIKQRPLHVYKRGRSLKDHLVQADPRPKYISQPYVFSEKKGCYRCFLWNVCNSPITGNQFYHPHKGNSYQFPGLFTCDTVYGVYLLKCPCTLVYVGMTTGPFKQRATGATIALLEH